MDFISLFSTLDKNSPLFYLVLLVYVIYSVAPLFKHKIRNSKLEHLDTRSTMIFNKAKHYVTPLADEVGLDNDDRRHAAVNKLYEWLLANGIKDVRKEDLYSVVDTAYKYMKGQGFLTDKQPLKTADPEKLSKEELENLTPGK